MRVTLFTRGTLSGGDRRVVCAVVNVSAAGAMLTGMERVPTQPWRLAFEIGEETIELPVELARQTPEGGVAVTFPQPRSERLYRLLAEEQRRGLAQGRANISERRLPRSLRPQNETDPPDEERRSG